MTDIIKTTRLELRRPVVADAPALAVALNNYEITKWLAKVPNPYSKEDALQFIASNADKVRPNYHIHHDDTPDWWHWIGRFGLAWDIG